MRRFFGLEAPKVTLKPTPYLRRADGTWTPPPGPTASSNASPISARQTFAPVNTVTNQDDLHELVNKIRFLTSMGSEDRPLILEVCDRASTDATAREAIRALMHEFRHGSAAAQLSAARLWAILLRNSSAAFIVQSTAVDFLEVIQLLVTNTATSPIVRNRVLQVLGDAVYNHPTHEAFRTLWIAIKPHDAPDRGLLYNAHDAVLRPSRRERRDTPVPAILDRINPPVPLGQTNDSRFPYTWEAPPPSYETATSTFDSFSTQDSSSSSYVSNFTDIGSNISTNLSQDRDLSDGSVGSAGSEGWAIVQPEAQRTSAIPPAALQPPRIQFTPPSNGITPTAPLSMVRPATATPRPTMIRRSPLGQAQNITNLTQATASTSSHSLSPAQVHAISNGKKPIYARTLAFLKDTASAQNLGGPLLSLASFGREMGKLSTVNSLVYASQYRETLKQTAIDLGVSGHPKLKAALEQDQAAVADTILAVLYSPADEQAVLALEDDSAQSVLDVIQDTLDNALLHTRDSTSRARRLLVKLAKACDKLPSSLMIFGVTQRDEHASFCGGFGDVFKAIYQGKPVALKHMRMFQSTDQRNMRRKFCREALVWQRLRHPHIVPLIGIDTESFPSSLCLVSPWMKNGTAIKYLASIRSAERLRTVDRLIREIAQGLAFLHDQRVVHGDLRGSNILVDDDGHACLTDFGLTSVTDVTATQTNNGAGSVRWMAPEALNPTACGLEDFVRMPPSDIYALACVYLELYTGFPPFHDAILHDAPVMLQVIDGVRPPRPSGGVIPDHIWSLMEQCWSHDFAERPTILGVVLELAKHQPVSTESTIDTMAETAAWEISSEEETYEGWVASAISPLSSFIDLQVNPRNHYVDLQEIGDGPAGTTLFVARINPEHHDLLALEEDVREQDERALLAGRPTFVAIKTIPIMPTGGAKLGDVLKELSVMRGVQSPNILRLDALYVDALEDALWIRMELMTRTLASVIALGNEGLVLGDRIIAGCVKDILAALEVLRENGLTPGNISSQNVLLNSDGVLKLTNLSAAQQISTSDIAGDAVALGALVLEMAGEPSQINVQTPRGPSFNQFVQMCRDPSVTQLGYRRLIDSAFIREACERATLAQLLVQCTAYEGRLRVRQYVR